MVNVRMVRSLTLDGSFFLAIQEALSDAVWIKRHSEVEKSAAAHIMPVPGQCHMQAG